MEYVFILYIFNMFCSSIKSLKIQTGESEAVSRRRKHSTMAKRKKSKGKTKQKQQNITQKYKN
jgi:hypothetical protein